MHIAPVWRTLRKMRVLRSEVSGIVKCHGIDGRDRHVIGLHLDLSAAVATKMTLNCSARGRA